MTESLAYIAGILDGEGSVSIKVQSQKGRLYYSICARISNTNEELIDYINMLIPGNKYSCNKETKGRLTLHEISWFGREAIDVLELLEPYLIVKRPLADIAKEFWYKCFENRSRHTAVSEAERVLRDYYRRQIDSIQTHNKRSTYG